MVSWLNGVKAEFEELLLYPIDPFCWNTARRHTRSTIDILINTKGMYSHL